MTDQEAPAPTPEEEALFPAKIIEMTNGQLVTIHPWGMATGRLLAPRVGDLVKKMNAEYGVKAIAKLIRESQDEVYEIVRHSLGWTTEQMDELVYEDLFTLAQGIISVCLFRNEDAGGILGKGLALAAFRRAADSSASTPSPPTESGDVI